MKKIVKATTLNNGAPIVTWSQAQSAGWSDIFEGVSDVSTKCYKL